MTIWDRQELADPLDAIIGPDTDLSNKAALDLILSQIPSLFAMGDSLKATYLGFRSVGLTPTQALRVLEEPLSTLNKWKEECPELIEFEYKYLPDLQRKVGQEIIRNQFMRNMTMFMFRDSQTISKSFNDMEDLSNREFKYLVAIRRFYSNHDFLNLNKALEPEKHRNNVVVLGFGNKMFEVVEDDDGEGSSIHERVIDVTESANNEESG